MCGVDSNFAFDVSETALALRRAFDRRAAALGVTRAQWRALARLSREDGMRQYHGAWMGVGTMPAWGGLPRGGEDFLFAIQFNSRHPGVALATSRSRAASSVATWLTSSSTSTVPAASGRCSRSTCRAAAG